MSDNPLPPHFIEVAREYRAQREQREPDHVADPLSDRALKLGRWQVFETAEERRQWREWVRRLEMILAGASPEEIGQSAPKSTIDAILYCVRARGLAALDEPANIERLSRCDAAAMAEINEQIQQIIDKAKCQ